MGLAQTNGIIHFSLLSIDEFVFFLHNTHLNPSSKSNLDI